MSKENTKKRGDVTPNDELRGIEWEAELNATLRNALKRHSVLNYVLGIAVVAMAIALVVLMPLKQSVPYVVRVDNLTGATSIGQTVQDFVAETELADKHWVKNFVIARERYNYRFLQHDYDTVKSFAGDTPWKQYSELFSGPKALDREFGENVLFTPEIISITLTENAGQKFATVRLTVQQRDLRTETMQRTVHKVATLRYEYKPRLFISEQAAIENPFGFTVLGYQTDSEFTGAGK
ncbi:MAG TPA: type IV secretion system protein [Eoetvoesiella sp.]